MCLGIPGKITEIYREHDLLMGKIDFNGIVKRACLEHVSGAVAGDYVLVHVGYALTRLDPEEAQRVFDLLKEMKQLEEIESDEVP